MNNHCQCCLVMLWARAMRAILNNKCAVKDVVAQRQRDPRQIQDKDFFRECAWAIYVAGFKAETVRKKWPKLEQAFCYWDYKQVCQNKNHVAKAATQAINRPDKADAVVRIAERMCQSGWATIKKQLLDGLTLNNQGNFVPHRELIEYLDKYPMIGEVSAIYILKNIGYDVAKPDKLLKELAGKFGYPKNTRGVQQFTSDISQLVGERISVVDTVLWNAISSKADLHFQCPCCGRQFQQGTSSDDENIQKQRESS